MEDEHFYDLEELKAHELNRLFAESTDKTVILCGFCAGVSIGLSIIAVFFLALAGGVLLGLGMMGTGFVKPSASKNAHNILYIFSIVSNFALYSAPYLLLIGIIGAISAKIRKWLAKSGKTISFFYGFFRFEYDQLFMFFLLLFFFTARLMLNFGNKKIILTFTAQNPDEYSFWLLCAVFILVSALSAAVLHLWWRTYYKALLAKFSKI